MDMSDGMADAGSAGEPHGRGPRAASRRGVRRPADHVSGSAAHPTAGQGGVDVPWSPTDSAPGSDPDRDPSENNGHPVIAFLRANPQVLVLLVICLVLGIGTFLVVLFGLATAGSDQTTGEPSGVILGAHALTGLTRSLVL
jgi:hypothetical protein